jgi:hypothetical protein
MNLKSSPIQGSRKNIIILFLIVVFVGGIISCLALSQTKSPRSNGENMANSFVLEVISTGKGSTYPKEGPLLHMRLFENGDFEYDDFPDYDPPEHTSFNVSVERRHGTLSAAAVQELIELAENVDFLNSKNEFPSFQEHVDDTWVTTIHYRRGGVEKTITATNFWDSQYNKELEENYPDSMVKILVRVEQLKASAIGKRSSQWLAEPKNVP